MCAVLWVSCYDLLADRSSKVITIQPYFHDLEGSSEVFESLFSFINYTGKSKKQFYSREL